MKGFYYPQIVSTRKKNAKRSYFICILGRKRKGWGGNFSKKPPDRKEKTELEKK